MFLGARRTFFSTLARLSVLLLALALFAAAPAAAQTAHPVSNLAAASGNGKLTVTWTNPSGAGTGVTEVHLHWREQGTTTWQTPPTTFVGATTSYEIQNLTNGMTYEVEIRLFWATLSRHSSWMSTTGTPQGPVTVQDEYTVTLDASNLRPAEGTTVTLTATLDRPAEAEAKLHFIKTRGTALAGVDFTLSPAHPNGSTLTDNITIAAGEMTFTATLKVTVDGKAEGDETIEIKVSGPLTGTPGLTNDPTLVLTIPANPGGDSTPTDDTPTDRQTPTVGGPPPTVSSDSDPDSPLCGESDREYLERFYEASGGDNWDENKNWKSDGSLGEWSGVETDEDENVISLRLEDNNLSGEMPTEELLCLMELKELALWGNDDLSGDVPEKLVLAVERAALRDIAEMLNLNPEWFENCEEPCNFEDWYEEGVTTDDDGRVTEFDFSDREDIEGTIPAVLLEQLGGLETLYVNCTISVEGDAPAGVNVKEVCEEPEEPEEAEGGGCALITGSGDSPVFGLLLMALLVFAALGRARAQG